MRNVVHRAALTLFASMVMATVACASSTKQLDSYVGQYRESAEPDTVYSISRVDKKLFLESPRMPQTELTVEGENELSVKTPAAHYTMLRDANGAVTGWHRVQGALIGDAVKIGSTPVPNHFREYVRSEMMIPMRDGVRLHAVMLRPKDATGTLPIVMERTPYGVAHNSSDEVNSRKPEMAQAGYIFVYEDIRGCFGSEGQFVMNRPLLHTLGDRGGNRIDESSDAYDTVAWLVKNVPENSGRVGVYGISYPGFLAMMAGIDPHPAVQAVSPQAPMTDVWMGDDFFHNGAFRQTYGYDYSLRMEGQKIKKSTPPADYYEYFLHAGNFENAAKLAGDDQLPTGRAFIEHPAYDSFWSSMSVIPWLTKVSVPTFEVGGWWDQEDMWGTEAEYAALAAHENVKSPEVSMMLGPWRHGSWAGPTTRHLAVLNFGQATTEHFREAEFQFFERYLKPCTKGECPGYGETLVDSFQTGSNTWKGYAAWPPKQSKARALYFGDKGALSFVAQKAEAKATYVSDPGNPVPYRKQPIPPTYGEGSQWYTWLADDQRFSTGRKDVAVWQMAIDHDLTVTGNVKADLFASTTGSDADWVVKLIDVYPDDAPEGMGGYQLMIAEEIFRGRYRESFTEPKAIVPGAINEYKWSLNAVDHVFLKGHKLMVTVQSSWFPLYDRNPQTFVPNIMTAPPDAYKAATMTIFESAQHASHLELPVVEAR